MSMMITSWMNLPNLAKFKQFSCENGVVRVRVRTCQKSQNHSNHNWRNRHGEPPNRSRFPDSDHPIDAYIYLEPKCPLFCLEKTLILEAKQRTDGFQVYTYIYIYMCLYMHKRHRKNETCVFKSVEIFSSLLGLFLQISMFQIQNGQVQTLRRTCRADGSVVGFPLPQWRRCDWLENQKRSMVWQRRWQVGFLRHARKKYKKVRWFMNISDPEMV